MIIVAIIMFIACSCNNTPQASDRVPNVIIIYTSNKAPITANDSLFLVNIDDNPDEMTNLANEHPEKVKELIVEYNKWYKKSIN